MGVNWGKLLVKQLRNTDKRFITNEGSTVVNSSGDSYSLSFALYLASIHVSNGSVQRL